MNWVPLISPFDDMVIEMRQELGAESYIHLAQLMKLWMENGELHIDAKFLKRNCGINAQRAEKVGEKLVETLEKVVRKLEKTCKIVGKKLQETCGKVASFDASNPRGSTRVIVCLSDRRERIEPVENPVEAENISNDADASVPPSEEIKFPKSPSGELTEHLYTALKARGFSKTVLSQKWVNNGVEAARELLKTEPKERVLAGINWFLAQEWWKSKLKTMVHIKKNWNQFEAASSVEAAPTIGAPLGLSRYTSYEELYPEEANA